VFDVSETSQQGSDEKLLLLQDISDDDPLADVADVSYKEGVRGHRLAYFLRVAHDMHPPPVALAILLDGTVAPLAATNAPTTY
jgi:hypothetical protein